MRDLLSSGKLVMGERPVRRSHSLMASLSYVYPSAANTGSLRSHHRPAHAEPRPLPPKTEEDAWAAMPSALESPPSPNSSPPCPRWHPELAFQPGPRRPPGIRPPGPQPGSTLPRQARVLSKMPVWRGSLSPGKGFKAPSSEKAGKGSLMNPRETLVRGAAGP